MTSLLRELVSVPMASWRSMRTVEVLSLWASWRATARPTTPPPMTCYKVNAWSMIALGYIVASNGVCPPLKPRDPGAGSIGGLGGELTA